ncbi:hypothetical protein B0H16DRAFT_1463556 [Mycena metata]|uniref:Uncharacterized protein n=1 Tax=Mycena metata TaxID=1033252 RepID=A0AAD7II99_9AGAR|nr:hypothetical protein B0H16DRAFT_1463556 [Mycena metata]
MDFVPSSQPWQDGDDNLGFLAPPTPKTENYAPRLGLEVGLPQASLATAGDDGVLEFVGTSHPFEDSEMYLCILLEKCWHQMFVKESTRRLMDVISTFEQHSSENVYTTSSECFEEIENTQIYANQDVLRMITASKETRVTAAVTPIYGRFLLARAPG